MCFDLPNCMVSLCKPKGLSIRVGGKWGPWQREMEMMRVHFLFQSKQVSRPPSRMALILSEQEHWVSEGALGRECVFVCRIQASALCRCHFLCEASLITGWVAVWFSWLEHRADCFFFLLKIVFRT